jgi:ribonuclease T2
MAWHRIHKAAHTAAVALSFLFIFAVIAFAQSEPAAPDAAAPGKPDASQMAQAGLTLDRRQNEPGRFDFYVLALSWSPSYCEAAAERAPKRTNDPQCGGRPYSFVVHGLWPQYEKGFPSYCQVPAPRLNRAIVGSALDLMPSPRLIFHEWDRHGTCSGLSAHAFFESVRKARAVVKIPAEYLDLEKPITVSPADVEEAFVKANPGMSRTALTVACDSKRLSEVRVCLTTTFSFRDCPETTQRACRRDKIAMPAVRGP